MTPTRRLLHCAAVLGVLSNPLFAATDAAQPASPFTFSGDLRLRYEWDWDSHTSAGVLRTDRDRARVRARAGVAYKFSNEWSFGARIRTGDRHGQQSPHLTFSSSDDVTDDFDASLDRYFVQYKSGPVTAWAGRNTTPFWQQNEIFWDEDVTPTGVAGSYDKKLQKGTLTTTAAAFYLPDGMRKLNGYLVGGQVKYTVPTDSGQLTLAAGLHSFDGKRGAENLRNRNGARGYLVGILSAQWSKQLDNGLPLVFGADLIENFENYNATDVYPFAPGHANDTSGYVFSVLYGRLKNPKDWQVGYYYAHIETFAVNASYAQDDWARFGTATQSDVTDFEGHEFRATYVITKNINVQARLFLVDAITSVQDAKRCRVDLNWKF